MEPSGPTSEPSTTLSLPPPPDSTVSTNVQSRESYVHMCSISNKRRALKVTCNTAAPINSLPNELFMEIFLLALPHPNGHCEDEEIHCPTSDSWAPLMLICRHWREIIVSAPRLWRVIDAGKDLRWTELAVSRSQEAKLDISFWRTTQVTAVSPILLPVAGRIAVLSFECIDQQQLAAALRLVNSAQSSLVELRLTRYDDSCDDAWRDAFPEGPFHSVSFDCQRFPAMKALTVDGVRASLKDPQAFFSRLRVLDVRECILLCNPPIFTLSAFRAMLANCTMLEEVRLSRVLSQFHRDQPQPRPGDSAQRPRVVSIPRLRELTIDDDVEVVSEFLSSLHVPANVAIQLAGEVHLLTGDPPGILMSFLPLNPRQTLPILDDINTFTLEIGMGHKGLTFEVRASSDHGAIDIEVKDSGFEEGDPATARVLAELVHLLSNAPLATLTVISNLADHLEESEWSQLFAGFRTLEGIDLVSNGMDAVGVFDALAKPQPGEHGARVVCPKLKKIEVVGPFWSDDTIERIVECLSTRAQGGATALEKLELKLSFDSQRDFEEMERIFPSEIGAVFSGEIVFGYDDIGG